MNLPPTPSSTVFSLNAHATYACRHSGACCTAGWSIPVEPKTRAIVGRDWLVPGPDGGCPQFDRSSGLCHIQRTYGEAMLPESCHHFPRRSLIDGRGTFVTLSHFCPTAAALLLDSTAPLRIVANPPAFSIKRSYEGLDAAGEWPPLLRPDVLFDDESFGLWEHHLVEGVGSSNDSVDATLARLAAVGEQLRTWSPERGSLRDWTAQVLASPGDDTGAGAARRYARFAGLQAFSKVAGSVPAGLDAPRLPDGLIEIDFSVVAPGWEQQGGLVLRFLAAKAFASWTAYQSRGIRTQIAELFMSAAVLRVECARACRARGTPLDRVVMFDAVRATDLLLVHLADRTVLMNWLGRVETDADGHARR